MRTWLAVLVPALVAGCGVGTGGSVDVESVSSTRLPDGPVWTAKFLCGTIPDSSGFDAFPNVGKDGTPALVPGTYLTSINVQNLDTTTAAIFKRAVEIRPQLERRGRVGRFTSDSLRWHEGFQVNCFEILRLLGDTSHILTRDFLEGYLVVRGFANLDVTAVYTFKNVNVRSFRD